MDFPGKPNLRLVLTDIAIAIPILIGSFIAFITASMSAAGTITLWAAYFWLALAWGIAVLSVYLLKSHLMQKHRLIFVCLISFAVIWLGSYEALHFEEPLTKKMVAEEVEKGAQEVLKEIKPMLPSEDGSHHNLPFLIGAICVVSFASFVALYFLRNGMNQATKEPSEVVQSEETTFFKIDPGARVENLEMETIRTDGITHQFDIEGELKAVKIKDFVATQGDSGSIFMEHLHIGRVLPANPPKIGHVQPFLPSYETTENGVLEIIEFEIDAGVRVNRLIFALKEEFAVSFDFYKDELLLASETVRKNGMIAKLIRNASGRYKIKVLKHRLEDKLTFAIQEC